MEVLDFVATIFAIYQIDMRKSLNNWLASQSFHGVLFGKTSIATAKKQKPADTSSRQHVHNW